MNVFLFVQLLVVVLSLILIFQSARRSFFKAVLPATFGAGVLLLIITLILRSLKVFSYDLEHFVAADESGLPYEVILSVFVLPFSGLAIYSFLNARYPAQTFEKYSLAVSNILMGLCIAMIFFAYTKWYPVFTFALMLLTLFLVEYKNKIRFMYRFYRTYLVMFAVYLVMMVPFHYVNHFRYNEEQTIKFKLLYVPFEGYFLLFSGLLISILLYEVFKRRFKLK